jgi:hypothetical protein
VFVKTVLCAHTRYYFKTHELGGGPVMASVHVNLARNAVAPVNKSLRAAPRTRLVHQCTTEFCG